MEGGNVEVRTTGSTPGDGNIILEVPLDYDGAEDGSLILIAEGEIQILDNISDSQSVMPTIDPVTEGVLFLADPDNLDLTLQAHEQITINGNINTGSGTLTIQSQQGDITINGELGTSSGDMTLQAPSGAVTVATPIETALSRALIGAPEITGNVLIEAQDAVAVNNINTSAASVGGDVSILSETSIQSSDIDASTTLLSEIAELAGSVELTAPGNIVFSSINASSDVGDGGTVNISASEGLVRGTGTIPSLSSTISTDGGNIDGNIFIFHDGGSTGTPFVIGGGGSLNGTEGDITTGTLTLSEVEMEESFQGSFEIGNIEILTSAAPQVPEVPEVPEDPLDDLEETLEETDCDCVRNQTTNEIDPTVDADSEPWSTVTAKSDVSSLDQRFSKLDDRLTSEFENYLNLRAEDVLTETVDLASTQRQLLTVQQKTGQKPALIYAVFGLDGATNGESSVLTTPRSSAPLELLLITANGDPTFVSLDVTRREILTMAQRLRRQVSIPSRAARNDTSYLRAAQILYQWLIAPVQAQLEAQDIDTISFITDAGLRSLPLATLHDGDNFIIQNYNIGLMPSLSLTDLTYQDISNVSALIAGTSNFADQTDLPGVPVELDAIASEWKSKVLQDNAFNIEQLKGERQQKPYGVIHLATHGEFNGGDLSRSYLYLYNERLSLEQREQRYM
jgi:CHAT domain-containing protein